MLKILLFCCHHLLSHPFFFALLLNQWWFHCWGFKFQTAALSVLCVMFQVYLSFVVNLLNVFQVWLPNMFLNIFFTTPVSPVITRVFIHFMFHIRCILYINYCISASFLLHFARHFCSQVLPHLSYACFLFFVYNYNICLICSNFSVCTAWFHNTVTSSCIHWLGYVCTLCLSCQCLGLSIENNANVQKLCVSVSTHSLPKWGMLRLGSQLFLHVYVTGIYSQFLTSKFYS